MDLQPYVDAVRHELNTAAAAAGTEAQDLADRLSAPLESAMRLALLEALSAATEEITRELAPGSVEVRLRGRDPEFMVSASFDEAPDDSAFVAQYDDDGGTWRVTLRLPEGLRSAVEAAARQDGSSLNSWLVRAAAVASQGAGHGSGPAAGHGATTKSDTGRPGRSTGHRVTGWVR
jgi:hypothetical protein